MKELVSGFWSISNKTLFGRSLHDRHFMGQAGRTRYFARAERETRGREKLSFIFIFSSSRASRSCRAPREISRSPRLAHKAPVMQANLDAPTAVLKVVSQLQPISVGTSGKLTCLSSEIAETRI